MPSTPCSANNGVRRGPDGTAEPIPCPREAVVEVEGRALCSEHEATWTAHRPAPVVDGGSAPPLPPPSRLSSSGHTIDAAHPSFGGDADPWAIRIQRACDAATAAGGGRVRLGVGRFPITSPITIKRGTVLEGACAGVWNAGYNAPGTLLEAAADLSAVIQTVPDDSEQSIGVRDLMILGSDTYSVGAGLKLRGRMIRVERVDVRNCSGIGAHFFAAGEGIGPSWVNWMINSKVKGSGELDLLVECSDSWFYGNYLGPSVSRTPGGSCWIGNHFDHAPVGMAGLTFEAVEGNGAIQGQVVGNYFDLNDTALRVTSHDGITPYRWTLAVQGNSFRANVVDVRVEEARGVNIVGSVHRGGGRTRQGIVFRNTSGGAIVAATRDDAHYPGGFWGDLPSTVETVAC